MQIRVTLAAIATLAMMLAVAAHAQQPAAPASGQPAAPPLEYGMTLSYAQARAAADAAIAASKNIHVGSAITVVGPAGEMILFERMDGTQLASVAISQAKAHTAVAFKRPSKAFRDQVDAGTLYILGMPEIIPSEGGVPIIVNNKVIGAIGVSGGTGAQDGLCARAGAEAVK